MKLQYISDSKGVTTGVFIPIKEWNELKNKYQDIEPEETGDIPQWHKDLVLARLENYKNDSTQLLDFNSAMNEIEEDL